MEVFVGLWKLVFEEHGQSAWIQKIEFRIQADAVLLLSCCCFDLLLIVIFWKHTNKKDLQLGCRHVAAAGSPTKQRALRDDGGGNLHFGTGIIGFLYLHNLIGQNAFHSLFFSSPPLTDFFCRGPSKRGVKS